MSSHDSYKPSSTEQGIRVCVRPRPLQPFELAANHSHALQVSNECDSIKVNLGATSVKEPKTEQQFRFSYCAPIQIDQPSFFDECGIIQMLDQVLAGFACIAFAYGQTGSGKTFSMTGFEQTDDGDETILTAENAGIIPRSIAYLFDQFQSSNPTLEMNTTISSSDEISPDYDEFSPQLNDEKSNEENNKNYKLSVSYYEVYNEQVYDLLSHNHEPLKVKWGSEITTEEDETNHKQKLNQKKGRKIKKSENTSPSSERVYDNQKYRNGRIKSKSFNTAKSKNCNTFYVANLTTIECETADDALQVLYEGQLVRQIRSHAMNMHSSRSHTVFSVYIESCAQTKYSRAAKKGKIMFVDLAGSERIKALQSRDESSLKETSHINRSLFALGKVIAALGEKQRKNHQGERIPRKITSSPNFPQSLMSPMGTGSVQFFQQDIRDRKTSSNRMKNNSPTIQPIIPYRESILTKLLMDGLQGDSLILMIACISPSNYFIDETINTLKYAARASRIRVAPVQLTNRDPLIQLVHSLQDKIQILSTENQTLKRQVEAATFSSELRTSIQQSLVGECATDRAVDQTKEFTKMSGHYPSENTVYSQRHYSAPNVSPMQNNIGKSSGQNDLYQSFLIDQNNLYQSSLLDQNNVNQPSLIDQTNVNQFTSDNKTYFPRTHIPGHPKLPPLELPDENHTSFDTERDIVSANESSTQQSKSHLEKITLDQVPKKTVSNQHTSAVQLSSVLPSSTQKNRSTSAKIHTSKIPNNRNVRTSLTGRPRPRPQRNISNLNIQKDLLSQAQQHKTGFTQPIDEPMKHSTQSTEQSSKPTMTPSTQPTQPSRTGLAQQSSKSKHHNTGLTQHSTKPTQHSTKPTQHSTKPKKHIPRLSGLGARPLEHTTKPTQHRIGPGEHKKTKPVSKPISKSLAKSTPMTQESTPNSLQSNVSSTVNTMDTMADTISSNSSAIQTESFNHNKCVNNHTSNKKLPELVTSARIPAYERNNLPNTTDMDLRELEAQIQAEEDNIANDLSLLNETNIVEQDQNNKNRQEAIQLDVLTNHYDIDANGNSVIMKDINANGNSGIMKDIDANGKSVIMKDINADDIDADGDNTSNINPNDIDTSSTKTNEKNVNGIDVYDKNSNDINANYIDANQMQSQHNINFDSKDTNQPEMPTDTTLSTKQTSQDTSQDSKNFLEMQRKNDDLERRVRQLKQRELELLLQMSSSNN